MTVANPHRAVAASGITFAVLFVAAVLTLGDLLGSVGDPDRQFVSHFASGANRARHIVGAYLLAGAGLFFLVFVTHLHALLRGRTQEETTLATIGMGSTIVIVVMLFASAVALSAVATSIGYADIFDEDPHEFSPDTLRLATQIGFLFQVFGMLAGALAVGATSLWAMRSDILPGWLAWLGLVLAFVLLFALFFLPTFALPIWVLTVSIVLLRRVGNNLP